MRHKEPGWLVEWRNGQEIPKVCHTCDSYGKDGVCIVFNTEPPEEFASEKNACESWVEELPF